MFCRCQQSQSDYSDILPRNGDGNEDGGGERKKKEGGEAKEGWPEGLIFSHFSTGAMRFYGTGSIIPSNITRNCILE